MLVLNLIIFSGQLPLPHLLHGDPPLALALDFSPCTSHEALAMPEEGLVFSCLL